MWKNLSKTSPAPNQTNSAVTQTISFCYDLLSRLNSKWYTTPTCASTSPIANYFYDQTSYNGLTITNGIGARTGMSDTSGSTGWSYDAMGRVSAKAIIINGVSKTVSTTYNLDGSTNTVSYPSGSVIAYTYSAAGRLTQVKDTAHTLTYMQGASYAPPGVLTVVTYGTVKETDLFNDRVQPCWYYVTTGTQLAGSTPCTGTATPANVLDLKYNFGLGVNDNGNVLGLTNDRDSNRSVSYTYDALNRIYSAVTPNTDCSTLPSGITKNWGETFSIDPWGNLYGRTVTKCSAEPLNVTPLNNNQLSGFGYDAAGNMTSNGGATYTYDAENRLQAAGGVTYTYDGDGNRVKKSNGTEYWGTGPLLESDGSGTLQREFIFAGGKRIARRDLPDGSQHYYFTDRLGSSDVFTNASGTIQNESDYYPYGGERVYSLLTTNQNYKFTAKERDAESGLDNFGARYNASSLGRFMTPDWSERATAIPYAVSGEPQSLNLYAYVRNDPVTRVDLDGHFRRADPFDIFFEVQAAAQASAQPDSGDSAAPPEIPTGQLELRTGQHWIGNDGAKNKSPISVTVEGGAGYEIGGKVGPVEAKGGAAIKGELEVSSNLKTKVSVKAEIGGNLGPAKLPGVKAEKVTKNQEGQSESPTVSFTPPGVKHGSGEATASNGEITVGVSAYGGWGGGISVTVRPGEIQNYLPSHLFPNENPNRSMFFHNDNSPAGGAGGNW